MFAFFKRHRVLIAVAALVLGPLFVYRAQSVAPAEASPLDKVIFFLSAPFEKLLSRAIDSVASAWTRYADVVGAREENVSLRRKLLRLEQEGATLAGLSAENGRLRGLLSLRAKNPELPLIAASVTAEASSPLNVSVRVDRGLIHGLREGAPVLALEGLVGRVQRVAWSSAEVLLLADTKMSLQVVLSRSRVRGRLVGTGKTKDFELRITGLLRTDDLRPGDTIVTSGLGGVFPAGIPVGKITTVEMTSGAQEPKVRAHPHVDFSRLEEVLVLNEKVEEAAIYTPEALLPDELRTRTTSAAAGAIPYTRDPRLLLDPSKLAKTSTGSMKPLRVSKTSTVQPPLKIKRPTPVAARTGTSALLSPPSPAAEPEE